jgi:hypothetical protein
MLVPAEGFFNIRENFKILLMLIYLRSSIFWDIAHCGLLKANFDCQVYHSRTTLLYIPQDSTLYNNRCENLKSYLIALFSRFHYKARVDLRCDPNLRPVPGSPKYKYVPKRCHMK